MTRHFLTLMAIGTLVFTGTSCGDRDELIEFVCHPTQCDEAWDNENDENLTYEDKVRTHLESEKISFTELMVVDIDAFIEYSNPPNVCLACDCPSSLVITLNAEKRFSRKLSKLNFSVKE